MNRALQIRIDRGLTSADVCEGSGVSPRSLKRLESGDDGTQAVTIGKVAAFYGVKPSSLLMAAIDEAAA